MPNLSIAIWNFSSVFLIYSDKLYKKFILSYCVISFTLDNQLNTVEESSYTYYTGIH